MTTPSTGANPMHRDVCCLCEIVFPELVAMRLELFIELELSGLLILGKSVEPSLQFL